MTSIILLNDSFFIPGIIIASIRENDMIPFHCAVFQSGAEGRKHECKIHPLPKAVSKALKFNKEAQKYKVNN